MKIIYKFGLKSASIFELRSLTSPCVMQKGVKKKLYARRVFTDGSQSKITLHVIFCLVFPLSAAGIFLHNLLLHTSLYLGCLDVTSTHVSSTVTFRPT